MDQELHNELKEIQTKLDTCIASLPLIAKHDKLLYGNGEEGLKVRLDRVEQRAKVNKWISGLALGGFFTAFAEWLVRKIYG